MPPLMTLSRSSGNWEGLSAGETGSHRGLLCHAGPPNGQTSPGYEVGWRCLHQPGITFRLPRYSLPLQTQCFGFSTLGVCNLLFTTWTTSSCSPTCDRSLSSLLDVCNNLDFPVPVEKTEGPSSCINFLRIEIGTVANQLWLP